MGYYIRAFCKTDTQPSVADLSEWLRATNPTVSTEAPEGTPWTQLLVHYKAGRQPIVVDWTSASDAQEEASEFVDELRSRWWLWHRGRVMKHLRETRCVVACQLLNDLDDDGHATKDRLLALFQERFSALLQADGEGFYDGNRLLVSLR